MTKQFSKWASKQQIPRNEKSSLTKKELTGFKEFAQILLGFSVEEIKTAIKNGDFIEVTS